MGNQSTSGIVEEEKATNEASVKVQEASSPDELKEENHSLDELKEENQKQVQEEETKDFQENAAEADSHDVEADKNEQEEHKVSVDEDCETKTDVEPNESNLEEERSKFDNEEQDQPCTLKGDMQNPNPKSISTMTNLNSTPHEAVDIITSELEEDRNMMGKETVETREVVDSCKIEAESCLVDAKVVQALSVTATLDIDDHDVEKKEDEVVVAEMASEEGKLLETCAHKEEFGRGDDAPQEEQSNSLTTLNDLGSISLLYSTAAENEKQDECFTPVEKKPMMNGLSNGDHKSCVHQILLPDQEINQLLISCSNAPMDAIKSESDIKENGDEHAVEIVSISSLQKVDILDEVEAAEERDEIGAIQIESSIAVTNYQEDDESTSESILERTVLREDEPSAKENDHQSEIETIEKCVLQLQSSTQIDRATKFEPAENTQRLSSITVEAETSPPSLSGAQHSDGKTHILEDSESKERKSIEMLDIVANPSNIGVQVELKKSPSFDFGLSFDTRSEESDQTPLLYQDRTPRRSFSSCSTLRFQNRSVQTEHVRKYEAVEVEEKTIRMERSNSEIPRAAPLNLLSKEEKANVFTKEKQENAPSDNKQENGLKASPSRDDGATISPKGNGKRKPRSSLFTTCICCTAAIS